MYRRWGTVADGVLLGVFLMTVAIYVSHAMLPGTSSAGLAGTWRGEIGTGASRFVVVLHLGQQAGVPVVAVINTGTANALTFVAGNFATDGHRVHFAIPDLHGDFDGFLRADGALEGTLTSESATAPIVLTRTGRFTSPARRDAADTPQHALGTQAVRALDDY